MVRTNSTSTLGKRTTIYIYQPILNKLLKLRISKNEPPYLIIERLVEQEERRNKNG